MKKRQLFIITIILFLILSGCSSNKSFKRTKEETTIFVNKYSSDLAQIVDNIIANKSAENITFKNISAISYKQINASDYIGFYYDSQGMLGGQYWGFYYISNDKPIGDQGFEMDLKKSGDGWEWKEADGNNYYYTEKLKDNWYYYYMDYDHI